jgi:hypothetical protein
MTAANRIHRAFALLTRAPLFVAIALVTLVSAQMAFAASTSAPGTTSTLIAYAQQQAQASGLDPDIFVHKIEEESGFNPTVFNVASGASGIAQIVLASHPNVNPWDPYASISYAAQLTN